MREERGKGVRRVDGELVQGEKEVGETWRRYFNILLNVGIGVGWWGVVENEGEVMSEDEEVEVSVRKEKKRKSAGMDGVYWEIIRKGAEVMAEWLARMFNVCWRKCVRSVRKSV